jgi:hypothetical protein
MNATTAKTISACRLDIPKFYLVNLKREQLKNRRTQIMERFQIEELEHKATMESVQSALSNIDSNLLTK